MTQKTSKSDSVQISSTEVFDHICQICADGEEKEALGFCTSCDMYMCRKCCHQHKKIPVTICHKVVGKEQFGDINTAKGLFGKRLIPTHQVQYPATCKERSDSEDSETDSEDSKTEDNLKNNTICDLRHILYVPKKDTMLLFLYQTNKETKSCVYEIGEITSDSSRHGRYNFRTSGDIKDIKIHPSERRLNYTRKQKHSYCSILNITIPKTNIVIEFCKEHDEAYLAFNLPAGMLCNAITEFNDGLAIAVNVDIGFELPKWIIQHLYKDGGTITEFYFCEDGKPLLDGEPKYLASNSLQDVLFIATDGSTTNSSLVLALDTKGTVIFKYTLSDLGNPCGLTCDTDGNVCIATRGTIIQIDKHGKKHRELLKANKDINFRNIGFNMKSQQLVVADSSYKITFFKFV